MRQPREVTVFCIHFFPQRPHGSGVRLIVVDEAARVSDELYYAVRPMLAVSGGRLVGLSTPFGKRGWFHSAWTEGADWERVTATGKACPRISAEFLEEERRALGERWYRQEYLCSFEDPEGAVFTHDEILTCRVPCPQGRHYQPGPVTRNLWPSVVTSKLVSDAWQCSRVREGRMRKTAPFPLPH